jgi:predicted O-methyltransferase YrrM
MPELAVIVPSRGRPDNIRRLIGAWDFTNAWDVADLVLAVDADDPEISRYHELAREHEHPDTGADLFRVIEYTEWMPMVGKLNATAWRLAQEGRYFALAFAGDDHVPETIGWAARYLTVLHEMGTGMVYGDDGYQGRKLSTEWAITADVVRALGRMVPAPVDHMYCDNSIMDLFDGAGAIRHLPEVRIEHRHPIAGKAQTDAQYQRVNHRDQFRTDRMAYERWRASGMVTDIRTVRALRAPDAQEFRVAVQRPVARPATMRRRTPDRLRSGPTQRRPDVARFPFSQEFKHVRGATPDEVGMALADMASTVPADQEIVELGVFQGRTALIMAWGAGQGSGAHVTAIDPWDLEGNVYDPPFTDAESRTWAEYRVRELGYLDRVQLVQAFSADVAETWSGRPVGLLFVDGDHTKDGARRDIEAWAPHLAEGARIAVDDYHHPDWPGVAEAVDELVAEGFLAPVEVFHDRLAVTRLAAEGDRQPRAITSEGVSPSPYPAAPGQVADEAPTVAPHVETTVVREVEEVQLPEVDTSQSTDLVAEGELEGVPAGTSIDTLTLPQIKALAKARGIVLGVRKDKKADALQALRDGR